MSWSSCASRCVPASPDLIVLAVLLAEMVKADSLLTGNPHWKLCHSVGMGKNLRKGIDQPNVQQHGSACLLLYTQRWYIPASDPKQMGSL